MRNRAFFLTLFLLLSFFALPAQKARLNVSDTTEDSKAQNLSPFSDTTLQISPDSLTVIAEAELQADAAIVEHPDSIVFFSKDSLSFPVDYKARDSVVYDIKSGKVYIYGNADVKYENIALQGHKVVLDWTTNVVTAETDFDSLGSPIGDVDFIEGGSEYKAKKLAYNFSTQKGKVYQVRTREGDGFLHAEAVKRNEYEEWYGHRGKYTTCNLEHPHFYLGAKKMKLVPDKVIVTGPANLVIADIPTPLYVPFAIFPVKKERTNGIIFPEYGDESGISGRGFFLRNGGYYLHFNDYADLTLTGDLYTNGSFALRGGTNYALRYKFNGNFLLQYGRNRFGDRVEPNFSVQNEFRVTWNHRQDSKARPGSSFASNVNFGSARFDRNFNYTQTNALINSNLNSNISYSKSWIGKPFNFSANMNHAQSLVTGDMTITLPNINFGVSRITPFKPKLAGGKKKWYEDIGFAYRLDIQNQMSGVDSTFFRKETLDNAKFGVVHNIPINTSFNVLKFVTVQPQINYNERWYFKTVDKEFFDLPVFHPEFPDSVIGQGFIASDTSYRFKTARDFDFSTNMTTRIFGMVQFKKGRIKAIRHVMSPQLSFRYRPDFGRPGWGYYRDVQSDTEGNLQRYSIFDINQGFPGVPPQGMIGGVGLALNNILSMKLLSKKDSAEAEKKVNILDNLNISTFYNIAADSVKLDPISITGYSSIFNGKFMINFASRFDPYASDSLNRRINTFMWESDKRLTRFTSASFALSTNFKGRSRDALSESKRADAELQSAINNMRGYYDFTVPYSLNLNFDFNVSNGIPGNRDTVVITAAVRFSLDVSVTPKWVLNMQSGYDIARKEIAYTQVNVVRDLHCWEMRFQWAPYPVVQQSYSIQINVKSPMLQELKVARKQPPNQSYFTEF